MNSRKLELLITAAELGGFTKTAEAMFYTQSGLTHMMDALENQIQRMKQQEDKEIRIAAYSSIAMHWLPEVLYRFHRECPKAEVNLRMVDHALEPQELLEQGKADVIFSSRYPKDTCD